MFHKIFTKHQGPSSSQAANYSGRRRRVEVSALCFFIIIIIFLLV